MGTFFTVVKYIGGLYLLYLGFKIWTSSPTGIEITTTSQNTSLSNFFSGLTITLGNPKVILFYLGFLPTFIDLERLGMGDVVIIAVIVSTVLGLTMLGYGYMASRAKQMVKSKRTGHLMNHIAGGVMMSTGAILIAKS